MICEAYKRRCAQCGYHYNTGHSGVLICPKCGTPRIKCGKIAVAGYRFCNSHGGPNPRHNFYGLGGGKLTTGEKSQFPLTRLAGKFMQMQKDGRLLSNRASLEVVRDRIQQLAERIDLNNAPDRLENIRKKWEKYKENRRGQDEGEYRADLDEEFDAAYHDYAAWKQMFEAIDLDRKLVESEVKIVKEIHAVLTAEDAYELTAQLLGSIITCTNSMKEIPEEVKFHFLKRIQYEFTRIVGDRVDQGNRRSDPESDEAEGGELDREELHDPGDQE
jgi:predicted  nucleic acid-binding Zn-ribbon protein